MIRGLQFELCNQYANYLQEIFRVIGNKNEKYFVLDCEVINSSLEYLVQPGVYSYEELIEMLKEEHYIIKAKICISEKCDQMHNIENYKEFQKSNYKGIVLICDSIYTDVYLKENEINIRNIAKKLGAKFKNVKLLTDQNDNRNNFEI